MIKIPYNVSKDPCKGNYLPMMKATSIHKIGLPERLSEVLAENRILTLGDMLISLMKDPHWIAGMDGVTAEDCRLIVSKLKAFGFDCTELIHELSQ